MNRRSFLTGILALVATPAIVRASSLMAVKPLPPPFRLTGMGLMLGLDGTGDYRTLPAYYNVEGDFTVESWLTISADEWKRLGDGLRAAREMDRRMGWM